jgi:hypothetical protein
MTTTTAQSPAIALRISLEADDMPALMDLAEQYASILPDRDRIAAIRVDEVACRLEMDIAARPVDPRRLH